jgi:hypothetical protein
MAPASKRAGAVPVLVKQFVLASMLLAGVLEAAAVTEAIHAAACYRRYSPQQPQQPQP